MLIQPMSLRRRNLSVVLAQLLSFCLAYAGSLSPMGVDGYISICDPAERRWSLYSQVFAETVSLVLLRVGRTGLSILFVSHLHLLPVLSRRGCSTPEPATQP
jgi:hypothetical protein